MSEAHANKRLILVDYDHTLTRTEDEYTNGSEEPNWEMISWVERMYYRGHSIVVWTARPWSDAPHIVGNLTRWEVRWHGIRCEKGGGDVMIDDKAVNSLNPDFTVHAESVMSRQPWPVGPQGDVWVDGGEQTDPPIYRGQIRHVLIEEVNERGEGVVHAENGLTIFVTGASARNDDVAILVTELRPDENAATAEVLE